MRYRVLGPIEMATDEGAPVALSGRLETLAAALLARAGDVVPVETLAHLVWGDEQPVNPTKAVQVLVSRLRSAAGAAGEPLEELATTSVGYRLNPGWLDAREFESRCDRGGIDDLEAGLAMWSGDAFSGHADTDVAGSEASRLERLAEAATTRLGEQLLEAGRPTDAVLVLERFVESHPLDERARAVLMRSLYAAGRHPDALASFAAYRRRLGDELGLGPSQAILDVEDEILRHDVPLVAGRTSRHWDTITVRFATTPAGTVAWGSMGSGPRVLVVGNFGIGLTGSMGRAFLERLADRAEVVLYDVPGAGLSDSDVTLEAAGASSEHVAVAAGGRCVLMTFSHALTAVALAHRRPDLVAGLISWGGFASGPDIFPNQDLNASVIAMIRSHWGTGRRLFAALASQGDQEAGAFAQGMVDYLAGPDVAARYLEWLYANSVRDLLPEVTCPALLVHYRGDRMTPFRGSVQMAGLLPDAELLPLDGDHTFPQPKDFDAALAAIDRFLRRLDVRES